MRFPTVLAAAALAAGLVAPAPAQEANKPVLTVYTYDSFASDYGPGPAIKKGFEATCDCVVKFVGLDSSIGAFNRIRLEGASSEADVLLGLDVNLAGDARASGLFVDHGADLSALTLPIAWHDPVLAPFDWGYFAFVYSDKRLAKPPHSFEQLAAAKGLKIAIQDPRSATPGLGLLMWVRKVYGDKAPDYWRRLKPRILTVTKSWWDSYSLFLKGEADMVLSYTTSPAYHIIAENRHDIHAAKFKEGHYLQMELAAVTRASKHPALARRFIAFLVGPEAQAVIPTTNWMYPVNPQVKLPDAFETLVQPDKTLYFAPDVAARHRKAWINQWLDVMGR
jgi:thiamine transport system substrate-binding protein